MLSAYVPRGNTLERVMVTNGGDVPEDSVWIDLVNPATGEDKLIERRLGIAIPTREEMQEIEVSSRLYVEHARALHDRDADVSIRHRRAQDHRRDLHPLRPSAGHRALRRPAPVHDRQQQARALLPVRTSPANPC